MQKSWLSFLIMLIATTANALVEKNLYNIEVTIPSKEVVDQKKILIQQEFQKLLQKTTGSTNSLPIDNAEQFVTQFTLMNPTEPNQNNQTTLKFSFDKNMINQALTTKNQPFLNEQRPLTIIWLKSSLQEKQELLAQIINCATAYSLPIVVPMLDLKELEIFQKEIINEQLIKEASQRYSADEIIIMNFDKKDDSTYLAWRSLISDWQLNIPYTELKVQANFFVEKLMEHFIKNYSANISKFIPKEVITIKIVNVINLEDYVKIENYLQNLTITKTLQTTKIQSGEVEFEIIAKGGKQAIRNLLSVNDLLKENNKNNSSDPNTLFYTLLL